MSKGEGYDYPVNSSKTVHHIERRLPTLPRLKKCKAIKKKKTTCILGGGVRYSEAGKAL